MSYITLTSGKVLQSNWDAKQVMANIVKGKQEGKSWMPLDDGDYYRISCVASVSEAMPCDKFKKVQP